MNLGQWAAARVKEGTALHIEPAPNPAAQWLTLRLSGPTHYYERAVTKYLLGDEPALVSFLDGEMQEGLRRVTDTHSCANCGQRTPMDDVCGCVHGEGEETDDA